MTWYFFVAHCSALESENAFFHPISTFRKDVIGSAVKDDRDLEFLSINSQIVLSSPHFSFSFTLNIREKVSENGERRPRPETIARILLLPTPYSLLPTPYSLLPPPHQHLPSPRFDDDLGAGEC